VSVVSKSVPEGQDRQPNGLVKSPRDLAAGLVLLAFAVIFFWGAWGLETGVMRGIGPGFTAKIASALLAGIGLCLVARSLMVNGALLEPSSLRGPACILGAFLVFALTMRGDSLGDNLALPFHGLLVAGPLAVFISALADPKTRYRDAALAAALITAVCALVSRYVLRSSLPLAPWLLGY
jgi:hypothetical protein